nr:unnamed protein product [Callosobruchus chinensis]
MSSIALEPNLEKKVTKVLTNTKTVPITYKKFLIVIPIWKSYSKGPKNSLAAPHKQMNHVGTASQAAVTCRGAKKRNVYLGLLIIHCVNPKVAKSVDESSKESISVKNPSKIDIVVTVRSGADELNKPGNCPSSASDDTDLKLAASDLKPPASSVESLSTVNSEDFDDSWSESQTPTTELFVCSKPGTYPSPDKCSDFYICHKKEEGGNAMERIKLSCPKGMTFDKNIKKCTARTDATCLKSTKLDHH